MWTGIPTCLKRSSCLFCPKWASDVGPDAASCARALDVAAPVASLMGTAACQVPASMAASAPTTPPPSKRQIGCASGKCSPPKQVRRFVSKIGDFESFAKPSPSPYAVAALPGAEVVAEEVVLPLSPLPAGLAAPLGACPAVDPAKWKLGTSTVVEPTATTAVPDAMASDAACVDGSAHAVEPTATAVLASPLAGSVPAASDTIRRRLCTKTPRAEAATAKSSSDTSTFVLRRSGKQLNMALDVLKSPDWQGTVQWVTEDVWQGMSQSDRCNVAWSGCRTAWCRTLGPSLRKSGANGRVVAVARARWGSLHPDVRKAVFAAFLADSSTPAYVQQTFNEMSTKTFVEEKVRASAMMLTYNNEKWLLPPAAVKRDLETGVSVARRIGWVKNLMAAVHERCTQVCSVYKDMDFALSIEICPTSFAQGIGRVHVHVFLKTTGGLVWMPPLLEFRVDGSIPYRSQQPGVRQRANSGWSGFFYVQAPKKGVVMSGGSKEPFTGYPVNVAWILTLLQAGKIATSVARELACKCVAGASRALAEIAVVEQAAEKQVVEQMRTEALKFLETSRKSWRRLPSVDAWLEQYGVVQDRYKFLVLEGPSGVGKTVFARTLVPEGKQVLEVNCAGGAQFDLREFRYREHGLILFDEIEGHQVQAARKLFQAGVAPVQLGASATGVYVYHVFLHRVRLVCCTNAWTSSVAALPQDQQDWLRENSVHVVVDRHLWSA